MSDVEMMISEVCRAVIVATDLLNKVETTPEVGKDNVLMIEAATIALESIRMTLDLLPDAVND